MKGKQLYLSGLAKDAPKQTKRRGLYLRPDSLILSGIILFLLVILSFSLGVERGKRITQIRLEAAKGGQLNSLPAPEAIKKETRQVEKAVKEENQEIKEPVVKEEKKIEDDLKRGYRIQVASFNKEDPAAREAARLKEQGYPAYHSRSGKYIVIYVGGFENEKEAKNNLHSLRQKYKDCILRKPRRL